LSFENYKLRSPTLWPEGEGNTLSRR